MDISIPPDDLSPTVFFEDVFLCLPNEWANRRLAHGLLFGWAKLRAVVSFQLLTSVFLIMPIDVLRLIFHVRLHYQILY